jgi:hypothetical protein
MRDVVKEYFDKKRKRLKRSCIVAAIGCSLLILFTSCKKEYPDLRRIPNGTHVWIKWENWPSYKAEGYDVYDYWIIDSLSQESHNYFYNGQLNFYFCHNEKGQGNVYEDNELQLKPSKEPFIDKIIH